MLSVGVNEDPGGLAGRDVAPRLDSTIQVNSDSEGPGQVSGELLDALERDHNVVVAPKRRVRRVFNDDDESVVPLSRGRFQARLMRSLHAQSCRHKLTGKVQCST